MTNSLLKLLRKEDGASALEFALVAPAFIALIIGIAQLGIFYLANAGLNNALAEGARMATLHPRPTEAQILEKINAARWGLDPSRLTVAPIVWGSSNGSQFATVSMSYDVDLNFIFVDTAPFTLSGSRRAYVYQVLS